MKNISTGTSPGSFTLNAFSIFILIALAFSSFNANGQDVVEKWASFYGGTASDYAIDIAVNDSGNIYVLGRKDEDSDTYQTVKFNSSGQEQWGRVFSKGIGDSKPVAITADNSGNAYITGRSNVAMDDYVTVKYNAAGDKLWDETYNRGGSNDWVADIAVDDSGNVFVTGYSWDATIKDYATVKYNAAGTQLWATPFNGTADGTDAATAIAVDDSGNVYVTGHSYNGTDNDYATVKYNAAGVEQWVAIFDSTDNDYGYYIAVDDSGNVLVTGNSSNGTNNDFATVKYNSSGVEQWTVIYNGVTDNVDEVKAIAIDTSGNTYVAGYSFNGTDYDYATVKYNSAGVEQWVALYDGLGQSNDKAYDMVADEEGNVYVNGTSYIGPRSPDNSYDYATVKYNTDGVEQWVGSYIGSTYESRIDLDSSGNVYTMGTISQVGESWQYGVIKYCDDIPVASISNDTSICEGEMAYLTASGGDTYSWSPTIGLSDTAISNPVATPTVTTTYVVIVSNECTSDTAYVTVNIATYHISDLEVVVCSGDSSLIYGEYRTEAGTYYDSLTAITGCDSIHSTVFTVNQAYLIEINDTICTGDSIMAGGAYQKTSGIYYDSLLTETGCDSIIVTDLLVSKLLNVDIGPDTLLVCDGEMLAFDIATGENVDSYLISNFMTTVYDTELAFEYLSANPPYSVLAEVTGTDGCVYSDRVILKDNSIYNMYQQYPTIDDPWVIFQVGLMPENVASWYWLFGDGDTLSGDPNPTHIYKGNGSIEACLVAVNDCETDSSCYTIQILAAGLENSSQIDNLTIYPNPSTGIIKITLPNPSNDEILIKVMNINGQLIFSEKRSSSINEQIDLTKSGKGIYLIKVETPRTTQVERIVIE